MCTWVSPKFHLKNPFESQNEGKKTAANFCQLFEKVPAVTCYTTQHFSLATYFARHIQSSRKLIVIIAHASPPLLHRRVFFSSNNQTILSVVLKWFADKIVQTNLSGFARHHHGQLSRRFTWHHSLHSTYVTGNRRK